MKKETIVPPELQAVPTNISQAYWCSLNQSGARFERAEIDLKLGGEPGEVSWFDQLFCGGIQLPLVDGKPLTLLLTGPPGSGKTTLAFELCYRLAKQLESAIYFSTDSDSDRLIENARQFGYIPENEANEIVDISDKDKTIKKVSVWGREKIKNWKSLVHILETAFEAFSQLVPDIEKAPKMEAAALTLLTEKVWLTYSNKVKVARPKVLVVDNLNILPEKDQMSFFERFFKLSPAARLVVFILDSSADGSRHHPWEYVCDNVIQLDSVSLENYFIRRIEVIKTRYQEHVLGKHQLKIYKMPAATDPKIDAKKMRRSNPYRPDGGIFIYPSLHYHLSRYKRVEPSPLSYVDTLPKSLSTLLEKGFPEGRCTAFIGDRGNHKSHLGYLHLLHRIQQQQSEAGLIISLRDDEDMTRTTLISILGSQEFDLPVLTQKEEKELSRSDKRDWDKVRWRFLEKRLADLEMADKIEVLYFHPGYITPEEFFHRMFISVHRLKKSNKKITVLFNSLDQLAARFPLCAKQEIFVPSMIEALCGDGVTSIFIAVQEPGQPDRQYGLLPMADLVLSFRRGTILGADYRNIIKRETGNTVTPQPGAVPDPERSEVVVEVQRFAGGERAGSRGILELVKNPKESGFGKSGLQFAKLLNEQVKYPKGTA